MTLKKVFGWLWLKFGQIGPDEFVPIAESCGWFEKIDTWVVQESFRAYPRVKAKLGRDFKLSLNLSSAQLNTNTIAPMLIELAAQHAIPPKYIQLEMTETLSVEYTKKADALLSVLRSHGFQIAIDDFGTGYTALLQLVEYPAQMIKFDKTFIDKTMRSEHRKMLEPLIDLCHSHGLQVTAEGVETREVADYLISIGCDYLQGFLYGQPTTLEALMPPITQSSQMGEAQKKSLGH